MTAVSFSPLCEIARELEVNNEKLYYYFKTHSDDAKEYLRIKSVTRNGKKVSTYYVRNDFAEKYAKTEQETEVSERDTRQYENLYYRYLEEEERRIEANGKSISTDDALWKDMEIVDSNLSKKCLKAFSIKYDKKPTSYDRKSIADIVYRHIFTKKKYFDICLQVLKEEIASYA